MTAPVRIGSLFTGIGGLDLGLEQAGVGRLAWACESDPFCRAVLERHWPGVPVFDDVKTLDPAALPPVEVMCGGFPCQDLSLAGTGAGLDGARSGLFFELVRIVRVVRPLVLVVENVAALLVRGLDRVLGELAALGYDAWWDCIPASAVGAPHLRDRLFIVAWLADAYQGGRGAGAGREPGGRPEPVDGDPHVADADRRRRGQLGVAEHGDERRAPWDLADGRGEGGRRQGATVADPAGQGLPVGQDLGSHRLEELEAAVGGRGARGGAQPRVGGVPDGLLPWVDGRTSPPPVPTVPHGWPAWPVGQGEPQPRWEPPRTRLRRHGDRHRKQALGNAVVPQVAEHIGRRIVIPLLSVLRSDR